MEGSKADRRLEDCYRISKIIWPVLSAVIRDVEQERGSLSLSNRSISDTRVAVHVLSSNSI